MAEPERVYQCRDEPGMNLMSFLNRLNTMNPFVPPNNIMKSYIRLMGEFGNDFNGVFESHFRECVECRTEYEGLAESFNRLHSPIPDYFIDRSGVIRA